MRPWFDQPLAAFDTETTSPDPFTARIVSAHVTLVEPGPVVAWSRSWIIDPGIPIPPGATAVHGIDDARVAAEGERPEHALPLIAMTLMQLDAPVVIMNAPFDLTVLREDLRRRDLPLPPLPPGGILDPLVLDKAVDRYRRGKRTLTALAAHYGVNLTEAHTAEADALAAAEVTRVIARRHVAVGSLSVAELQGKQARAHADQARSLAEYFTRQGNTAAAATVDPAWPIR